MLGLVKVIVVMALMATIGGLAVHWAKDQTTAAIHRAVDTSLPTEISAHAWAPLSHGRPVGGARVAFDGRTVTTARCHTALGSYSVRIDHSFSFSKASTPVRAGCPGRQLAAALRRAARAQITTHSGKQTLTFTTRSDHTVATLQGWG